jgi:transcriptional regulator with XRE-family HTH domain
MKVKKMVSELDNYHNINNKRYKQIVQIQEFINDGCSFREIARRLGISRNTVSKFKEGDPKLLCQYGIGQSKLDGYRNHIIKCLENGYSKSKTVKSIYELGYTGGMTNSFEYLKKVESETGKMFEPQKYLRTMTEALKYRTGSKGKDCDFITRNGVFKYLWLNDELSEEHRKYIFEHYPILYKIQSCIKEFRCIFEFKNVQWLYLFILKHKDSKIKEIQSFAKGLNRDIDAVENAVTYEFSNGFVEGTNSKLKMVKRTMYGRCNISLLSAKMMLLKSTSYG